MGDDPLESVGRRGPPRAGDGRRLADAQGDDSTNIAQSPEPDGRTWVRVGQVSDFPKNGGATIRYGRGQIAVFNFSSRGEWYACQNMCPHKRELVLARGIVGDQAGIAKVACPLHKKTFSLETGACLSGEDYSVQVFPVKVEDESVYLWLPSESECNERLAPEKLCREACSWGW